MDHYRPPMEEIAKEEKRKIKMQKREEILGRIPPERVEFILPHRAQGDNVIELTTKEQKILVSFTEKSGEFHLDGVVDVEQETGVIVSGVITDDVAKVNHIEVDDELRGTGVGKALLGALEAQLKERGVRRAYAVFAKGSTVAFFTGNGYKIIPRETIPSEDQERLEIDIEQVDSRVKDNNSFAELQKTVPTYDVYAAGGAKGEKPFSHIVLVKEIAK